mmetsp:Transcript_71943/g.153794  ORF Transcript_71943/g.153794 Transcript_71943/m.153794 type:complete len:217 (-) Transcript_71943:841-1491(-)
MAYCAQSNMGDHGTGPLPSWASSLRASVPASLKSSTCCNETGFRFSSSCMGTTARSMTQRMAEKGSRTCARGMSMPMICASRGTSKRGKTTPGLSQRQVRSSRTKVCKVFVWPGVALTLTTLPPMMLFTREDLPTLGWPTKPSMTRPSAAALSATASAASTVASSAAAASASARPGRGARADGAAASTRTRWQASMSASRPTCKGWKAWAGTGTLA